MRRSGASARPTTTRQLTKPDEQWRLELTPVRYHVLRKADTQMPFTGRYLHSHRDGRYRCAGSGARLFSSGAKSCSGTGWPGPSQPAAAGAAGLRPGNGLVLRRPRSYAAAAAVTSATCSTTAPARPGGTASTHAHWRSSPRPQAQSSAAADRRAGTGPG